MPTTLLFFMPTTLLCFNELSKSPEPNSAWKNTASLLLASKLSTSSRSNVSGKEGLARMTLVIPCCRIAKVQMSERRSKSRSSGKLPVEEFLELLSYG